MASKSGGKKPPSSREPLSKDRVLAAAVALADKGGIRSMSMRKLGEALGVEAMSLYSHVANKDDILDGIVDRVVGEITLPDPKTPWKAAMRQRAIAAHAMLVRHPWASVLIESRLNLGPARLRYFNAGLGTFREAGFSVALTYNAVLAIDSYVYGFALQEVSWPFDEEDRSEVVAAVEPQVSTADYPYVAEVMGYVMKSGAIRSAPGATRSARYADEFEFGLALVLDGLEKRKTRP